MSQKPNLSLPVLALRLAALIGLVVLATWAAHEVRSSLDLDITPENEEYLRRAIKMAAIAYIGLLALPFVPGAEIGLALIAAFGTSIVPLVYVCTVLALLLSYTIGSLVPADITARVLATLRLRRAAALVTQVAPLSRQDRLELMLSGAPPKLMAMGLKHRYLALGLAINTPGNSLIGGGGGIALMAGLSGIFAPLPMALTVMIAVSPIPIAVWLFGY